MCRCALMGMRGFTYIPTSLINGWTEEELKILKNPYRERKKENLGAFNVGKFCPMDNGKHKGKPIVDLGLLDTLPLELLTDILLPLDLRTLTDFRRVNRRAMQIVNSLPNYNTLVKCIPDVLRSLLVIEAGANVSCLDLYDKLCTTSCELCEAEFGGFLHPIIIRRVCGPCLRKRPETQYFRLDMALEGFGLTAGDLEALPSVRGWRQVSRDRKERVRSNYVSLASVREVLAATTTTTTMMITMTPNPRPDHDDRIALTTGPPLALYKLGDAETMTLAVRLPSLDVTTNSSVQGGSTCKACMELWNWNPSRELVWSPPAAKSDAYVRGEYLTFESLRTHLMSCQLLKPYLRRHPRIARSLGVRQ